MASVDFTTLTKVGDAGNTVVATADKLDATAFDCNNSEAYYYLDKGAAFFTGYLEFNAKVNISLNAAGSCGLFGISDDLDDFANITDGWTVTAEFSAATYSIRIYDIRGGSHANFSQVVVSGSTDYWVTVHRYTDSLDMYMYVWSDEAMTTLVGVADRALGDAETERYLLALGAKNNATAGREFTGYVEDLYIDGAPSSDLCVGGTPSAKTFHSAPFTAAKAFDDDIDTRWSSTITGSAGEWIQYQFASGHAVTNLNLKANTGASPNGYKVQGSNNGSDWDDLASGNLSNVSTWQSIAFTNTTTYTYCRLLYDGAGYDANSGSIWEIEVWAVPVIESSSSSSSSPGPVSSSSSSPSSSSSSESSSTVSSASSESSSNSSSSDSSSTPSSSSSSPATSSSSSSESSSSPQNSSSSSDSSASSMSSSESSSSPSSVSSSSSSQSVFASSSSSSEQEAWEEVTNEQLMIIDKGQGDYTIQNRTETARADGSRAPTWADDMVMPGWLQPVSSDLRDRYSKREIKIDGVIYVAKEDPQVTEGDRIVAPNAKTYLIHGVEDQAGLGKLWHLDVEEVR